MKTLYITIKEVYFNEILSGTKTTEYREVKPFWTSRLYEKNCKPKIYDAVYFKAGYDPGVPEMVVEYLGVRKLGDLYHIKLGKVLSKKNVRKAKPIKKGIAQKTEPKSTGLSPDFFIQYHNADARGSFPFTRKRSLYPEEPDQTYKHGFSFYTRKISVLKAIGGNCFIVVGVGGAEKRYYLWTMCRIDKVTDKGEYNASGPGFNLKKAVLLNDIVGFTDFKKFCGNFGIGFQKINNHPFHKMLLQLARKNISA